MVLYSYDIQYIVRMAEWSKALRSGRSPLLWAWVRIPLLTKSFYTIPATNHAFPIECVNLQYHSTLMVIPRDASSNHANYDFALNMRNTTNS